MIVAAIRGLRSCSSVRIPSRCQRGLVCRGSTALSHCWTAGQTRKLAVQPPIAALGSSSNFGMARAKKVAAAVKVEVCKSKVATGRKTVVASGGHYKFGEIKSVIFVTAA